MWYKPKESSFTKKGDYILPLNYYLWAQTSYLNIIQTKTIKR